MITKFGQFLLEKTYNNINKEYNIQSSLPLMQTPSSPNLKGI